MPDRDAADRLLRSARREALLALLVWALACLYTIGYCYLYGYPHAPDGWAVRAGLTDGRPDDQLTFGLPDWVVRGILLPWAVGSVVTIWFAVGIMTDEDLGADAGGEVGHGP
jgi:hypothetical protein